MTAHEPCSSSLFLFATVIRVSPNWKPLTDKDEGNGGTFLLPTVLRAQEPYELSRKNTEEFRLHQVKSFTSLSLNYLTNFSRSWKTSSFRMPLCKVSALLPNTNYHHTVQPCLICIILELVHNASQKVPSNISQHLLKVWVLCLILLISTL